MIKSVVGFFAHPDDETVFCGGITTLMTRQGIDVHFVVATRGEGGEVGEPPVATPENLGSVREKELRCAAQALGATVTVLDYIDPRIGPDEALYAFEADFDGLARQFAEIARHRRADLVLTHGADGEYGHPAHKLVHQAVLYGMRQLYPDALVYTVAANVPTIEDRLWNQNEPAHLALDIRPWAAEKIAAMECHQTQHDLFKRRRNLNTVDEAMRPVESVRRAWPPTDEPPQDAFANLLRTAGAWMPT